MITFTICLLALIAGYFIYGRLVERVFGPDDRKTPALTHADGVDYIPLPTWKIFMIQFLNIAGLGPIFGAIMGAKFGTASYLWLISPECSLCVTVVRACLKLSAVFWG